LVVTGGGTGGIGIATPACTIRAGSVDRSGFDISKYSGN